MFIDCECGGGGWVVGVCMCHKRKIMLAGQYPHTMMFAGSVTNSILLNQILMTSL